jgi:uncharacterized protein involved in oxidation of intracellular sulfur
MAVLDQILDLNQLRWRDGEIHDKLSGRSSRPWIMKTLFIINNPPYGTEQVYNALRLAHALLKKEPRPEVTVFLMADAVVSAKAGQKTPDGYYNVERMLKRLVAANGKVLLCGTCMDARGLDDAALIADAHRSSMDELAAATAEAEKILVF